MRSYEWRIECWGQGRNAIICLRRLRSLSIQKQRVHLREDALASELSREFLSRLLLPFAPAAQDVRHGTYPTPYA